MLCEVIIPSVSNTQHCTRKFWATLLGYFHHNWMATIKFYEPTKNMGKQNNKWLLWSMDDLTFFKINDQASYFPVIIGSKLSAPWDKCFTQVLNTTTQARARTQTAQSELHSTNHEANAHMMTGKKAILKWKDFSMTVWTLNTRWGKLSDRKYGTCWQNTTSQHIW